MKSFLRFWQEFDLVDIEKHLIVIGELSAECFACHKVGIDRKSKLCPACNANFKYMGFRRKIRIPHLRETKEEFVNITFIDFEDFKKSLGKRNARNLLDI